MCQPNRFYSVLRQFSFRSESKEIIIVQPLNSLLNPKRKIKTGPLGERAKFLVSKRNLKMKLQYQREFKNNFTYFT